MDPNGVLMPEINPHVCISFLFYIRPLTYPLEPLTGANGVKMKIWQCFSNLPQQTWTPDTSSGNIQLTTANFCLDLTNGDTTDQNILQIWQCGGGNPNQIWTVTSA